jgi:hypothetical protein
MKPGTLKKAVGTDKPGFRAMRRLRAYGTRPNSEAGPQAGAWDGAGNRIARR